MWEVVETKDVKAGVVEAEIGRRRRRRKEARSKRAEEGRKGKEKPKKREQ